MDNIPFGVKMLLIIVLVIIVRCIYYWCCRDTHKYRKLNTNTGEYDNDIPEVRIQTSNTLDLHGVNAKDAKSKLECFLEQKEQVRIQTSNTLYLHGVNAKDAKSKLECFLEQKEQERKWCNGSMKLEIITGKGIHSHHGHPVLKPVVKKYLENNGYKHNVDPKNTGRLFVQLP